jgi:predicted dehydrogenase
LTRRLRVAMVGCGGMGSRHVSGYGALEQTGLSNVELVAVCDLQAANAARIAGQAEEVTGRRPRVHLSVEAALADEEIDAFDVVTDASSHPAVVLPMLEAGRHVLCEKPLALTVASGMALVNAARRAGVTLATAENYRRDPCNRLAKAVIDSGLLGEIYLMRQVMVGGGNQIIITPWRHLKERGAIGLDMGAHLTDLIQYYLGPFGTVFGRGFIAEPVRYRREQAEMDLAAYTERLAAMPEQVVATGEDSFTATYEMRSGVTVQVAYIPSGPGHRYEQRTIHGRAGSLEIFKDRTGRSPVLHRADGSLSGRELAEAAGGVSLDPVTERLFGTDFGYERSFAETDAGLLAVELHDFAAAVLEGRSPEVDGYLGVTAVAAVLAAYESGLAGEAVALEDVMSGKISRYQDDIDAGLADLIGSRPGVTAGQP